MTLYFLVNMRKLMSDEHPIVSGACLNGDCTHCMACICGCPAECIEYGKHTKRPGGVYYLK